MGFDEARGKEWRKLWDQHVNARQAVAIVDFAKLQTAKQRLVSAETALREARPFWIHSLYPQAVRYLKDAIRHAVVSDAKRLYIISQGGGTAAEARGKLAERAEAARESDVFPAIEPFDKRQVERSPSRYVEEETPQNVLEVNCFHLGRFFEEAIADGEAGWLDQINAYIEPACIVKKIICAFRLGTGRGDHWLTKAHHETSASRNYCSRNTFLEPRFGQHRPRPFVGRR